MFSKTSLSLLTLSAAVGVVNAAASNVSTACHNTENFTQIIDHASGASIGGDNGTFLQQYQLDLSSYKPGGPILFFQGNEAQNMFCIENLILPTWAKELDAAVATLEHRFFGYSNPSTASDLVKRYETLTLDNVMFDSISFIDWVKSNVTGAKDSKVIVQGASYGASLSTWLRLNHPETFYGAISSAPGLRALNAPDNASVQYNWQTWISSVYYHQSAKAANTIKNALLDLDQQGATAAGRAKMQQAFNLCSPVNSTTAVALLRSYVQATYWFATQFNFGNVQRPFGVGSPAFGFNIASPLQAVINKTLSLPANHTLSLLNVPLALYQQQFGGCVDISTGVPQRPAIESTPFDYITCHWLPLQETAVPTGAIFPPSPADNSFFDQFCKQSYNTTPPTQDELQKKYHFTQADIQNSTRLLIAEGEHDPTSAVGAKTWDFAANPNTSRIMSFAEMAHCEDTYKPIPGDRETVVRARQYELETIKEWLGMYE